MSGQNNNGGGGGGGGGNGLFGGGGENGQYYQQQQQPIPLYDQTNCCVIQVLHHGSIGIAPVFKFASSGTFKIDINLTEQVAPQHGPTNFSGLPSHAGVGAAAGNLNHPTANHHFPDAAAGGNLVQDGRCMDAPPSTIAGLNLPCSGLTTEDEDPSIPLEVGQQGFKRQQQQSVPMDAGNNRTVTGPSSMLGNSKGVSHTPSYRSSRRSSFLPLCE